MARVVAIPRLLKKIRGAKCKRARNKEHGE
jgi:hypothetical protein